MFKGETFFDAALRKCKEVRSEAARTKPSEDEAQRGRRFRDISARRSTPRFQFISTTNTLPMAPCSLLRRRDSRGTPCKF